MDVKFNNTLIRGILNVLPEKKVGDQRGIERYKVKDDIYTTELFVYAMKHLLKNNKLSGSDIGAIVTVSFTPDYMIPQLSFMIHAALDLPEEVFCTDIMEENVGYIKGLLDAMLIAERMPNKKVVLLCGNISDKRKKDDIPFYGNEGVSVTILESSEEKSLCSISCSIDSTHINDIKKCSGGFFDLFHEKGNQYINNTDVLSAFMQEKIPLIIDHLIKQADVDIGEIEFFSIPEIPGMSMEFIEEQLGIDGKKIMKDTCGVNDSLNNSLHIAERYSAGTIKCCLVGYGAGFNYGGAVLELKQLEFCDTIHSEL